MPFFPRFLAHIGLPEIFRPGHGYKISHVSGLFNLKRPAISASCIHVTFSYVNNPTCMNYLSAEVQYFVLDYNMKHQGVVNKTSTVIIADFLLIGVTCKQQLAGPKIEILTLNVSADPSLCLPDRVTSYC